MRAAPAADTQASSTQTFRSLFQALQVGVMLNGPNGEILFVNQAALDMFGVTEQQVAGKKTRDVDLVALREDGSECPVLMRPIARAIRTKKPVVGQVLGWHRAGSDQVLWTLVTAVPEFTERGELRNVITTLTDITDRKNTEAALRRAAELNRQILLSAQEGIIVHDRQLRYVLWNPYMERMTGLKESDIVGKHPLELFPFMAKSGTYADLEKALEGQTVSAQDAVFEVPQTNHAGWCDSNFAPLRDAQGEIIGVVATVRDSTERKETEDRLKKGETLLAQAEQLANVGSWELDLRTGQSTLSKNLVRIYGLASEEDWDPAAYWERVHPEDRARARSIGRQIARDLHDSVSQKLLAISLNLAQLAKSAQIRHKSARHILADTRKDVRDLSKEVRSLSYLLHPPLLDELGLASAIEEYAKGFSQRSGINLEFEMASDVGRMSKESETAFFRIVQEALGNIQKHSGSSIGKIRLMHEGEEVVLEIVDAGRGMAAENLRKRLASSGTLGVGILGMRERMRQLGGRLEITSGDWGTTVKAVLPLRGEDNNASSHPASG